MKTPMEEKWSPWWAMALAVIVVLLGSAVSLWGLLVMADDLKKDYDSTVDGLGVVFGGVAAALGFFVITPWIIYLVIRRRVFFVIAVTLAALSVSPFILMGLRMLATT